MVTSLSFCSAAQGRSLTPSRDSRVDRVCYGPRMCRSIKRLREPHGGPNASDEEVAEAALQFVRKVSGYRVPAPRNADVFNEAVDDASAATRRLLASLQNR